MGCQLRLGHCHSGLNAVVYLHHHQYDKVMQDVRRKKEEIKGERRGEERRERERGSSKNGGGLSVEYEPSEAQVVQS